MSDCNCDGGGTHDLRIPVGVDYGYRWPVLDATTGLPKDLTGWTAKMQIRNRPLPSGVLRDTFTTDDSLTTGDGYVDLHLEETDTADWSWPQGVYDIHLWNPANEGPFYLTGGKVCVIPGVTTGPIA